MLQTVLQGSFDKCLKNVVCDIRQLPSAFKTVIDFFFKLPCGTSESVEMFTVG